MKPFVSVKMAILLGGLGAALTLAPACKAQAEIAPDHFDGTDSWETAHKPAVVPKTTQKPAAKQAKAPKTDPAATMKLASASDPSKAPQADAVALQDKRKAATQKTKKQ
ncbi:MAG TPA: hypothetical protein VED66_02500 [Candidatus Sulfotelmatobacter sp.]|nr:hypothetical protein [Candidatus Sulfotelmatobacter sp.]